MVGWYGGSEEYALISSLRFSRETFRKQRLQAPISVTPEHPRKADRQMLVDAISPSHSPTLSRIPVDAQSGSWGVHLTEDNSCLTAHWRPIGWGRLGKRLATSEDLFPRSPFLDRMKPDPDVFGTSRAEIY